MLPTKFQFIWLKCFRGIFICNSIHSIYIYIRVISLSTQKFFFFRKHTIINMNCLWRPCLLMDRDEISSLYRGPSIDASYQVSVHLAKRFKRRRLKCEKLTDDGRQVSKKIRWLLICYVFIYKIFWRFCNDFSIFVHSHFTFLKIDYTHLFFVTFRNLKHGPMAWYNIVCYLQDTNTVWFLFFWFLTILLPNNRICKIFNTLK